MANRRPSEHLDATMREVRWFNSALFLILFTLKLCHVIDWSWWLVFAPFWWPIIVAIVAIPLIFLYLAD